MNAKFFLAIPAMVIALSGPVGSASALACGSPATSGYSSTSVTEVSGPSVAPSGPQPYNFIIVTRPKPSPPAPGTPGWIPTYFRHKTKCQAKNGCYL